MTTDTTEELRGLNGQLTELETTVQSVQEVTTVFQHELAEVDRAMKDTSKEAKALSRSIGTSLRGAFDALVFEGARPSDVVGGVGRSIAGTAFSQSILPVQNALGTFIGAGIGAAFGGTYANGGAFAGGRVTAFAKGGVVDRATAFPMRNGTGLMGEAGPEAIMPLARGADGRLGVKTAGGGRPVQVTVNVSTPDVAGFNRSKAQVAAGVSRALRLGARNL